MAYGKMPLINVHADVSSKTRGLNFGLSLNLNAYFVYAGSKGFAQSVEPCLSLHCDKLQNLDGS